MNWDVVYEKAIRDDGSLLFPKRLSHEFLANARRTMGSYLFANQYQNQVIPEDERRFKLEWIKYGPPPPELPLFSFGFIDPAIGQKNHNDYTGIAIVQVDPHGNWYVRLANRYRFTPTEIIEKMFSLCSEFSLTALGVEVVAYQEALLYMLDQEMRARQKIIPVKGIRRMAISKEVRILGLVPRFEWGRIFMSHGLRDFEDEYSTFPRGSHDDILDALASLEELVSYPTVKERTLEKPPGPNHPDWERWYIQDLRERAGRGDG